LPLHTAATPPAPPNRAQYPYPNASNNFFQLIQNITTQPPPSVPADAGLSDDLQDMIACCLNKEPTLRPTVTELQAHPWMKAFDMDEMDLSMKLEEFTL
jgi:serine/threonine protein kinase